ncbi:hypothetical protein [Marinactinospora rubrisoli]|uniref:Uncharacterized protein n=1 Tax=Marinactinospora rubrisoli TaxID=2715399 RepID=A0ABW2KQS2_9ACTN
MIGDDVGDHPEGAIIAGIGRRLTTPEKFEEVAWMSAEKLHAAQMQWRAEWARGFQSWLRYSAPADRRDPTAVVDGRWPLIPPADDPAPTSM